MGAISCHGNQSSDLICTKTCCSLSPTPMMLHIKFDCNRPAGLGDIHVWKCGRTHARMDARTPARVPSYKLTLWAFGSGELINRHWICLYTLIRIIVTLKICFYFISCWKSIPKDAKLYLNKKDHLKMKFTKLEVLRSSLLYLGKNDNIQLSITQE